MNALLVLVSLLAVLMVVVVVLLLRQAAELRAPRPQKYADQSLQLSIHALAARATQIEARAATFYSLENSRPVSVMFAHGPGLGRGRGADPRGDGTDPAPALSSHATFSLQILPLRSRLPCAWAILANELSLA